MAPINFTLPEISVINDYQTHLAGGVESVELQNAYPEYLKILKFQYPPLNKAIMFLNRFLVSTITDDSNLAILSNNLMLYLQGPGED